MSEISVPAFNMPAHRPAHVRGNTDFATRPDNTTFVILEARLEIAGNKLYALQNLWAKEMTSDWTEYQSWSPRFEIYDAGTPILGVKSDNYSFFKGYWGVLPISSEQAPIDPAGPNGLNLVNRFVLHMSLNPSQDPIWVAAKFNPITIEV